MKNLLTTEQENAREAWREHSRAHGRVNYDDEHDFHDEIVSNVIKATLDSVRVAVDELSEGADGSTYLFISKDVLLNHLKELEKGEV